MREPCRACPLKLSSFGRTCLRGATHRSAEATAAEAQPDTPPLARILRALARAHVFSRGRHFFPPFQRPSSLGGCRQVAACVWSGRCGRCCCVAAFASVPPLAQRARRKTLPRERVAAAQPRRAATLPPDALASPLSPPWESEPGGAAAPARSHRRGPPRRRRGPAARALSGARRPPAAQRAGRRAGAARGALPPTSSQHPRLDASEVGRERS